MTDETLITWNQKMTEASKAIRVTSQELTKLQKKHWKATYLEQFEDIIAAGDELQRN